MLDKSNLRKCKYHRVAHLEKSDFSTALKDFDGFVDMDDYDKLYDENYNPVPVAEFALDHQYRDIFDREKFHKNKEIIAELYEIIREKQGSEGFKKAQEIFRREIGCYSIDEKKLFLALPYQADEIRILRSIVKKIKG